MLSCNLDTAQDRGLRSAKGFVGEGRKRHTFLTPADKGCWRPYRGRDGIEVPENSLWTTVNSSELF